MLPNSEKISEIISECESSGAAAKYITERKDIASEGKEVIVVSDFHLAAGKNEEGNYTGTENFFADRSFDRFLNKLDSELNNNKGILVINGDFIDFLRIVDVPIAESEFQEWENVLNTIGIKKTKEELRNSIKKSENEYGLKCDEIKSVWKFHKCVNGHKALFEALANWLEKGHQIIITKGNHDLEFYFKGVRDYLRAALLKLMSNEDTDLEDKLNEVILPNLIFVDDDFTVDGEIYIAHGHKYDKFSNPKGGPLYNESELNIPFGSFLNRYLINRVELSYPFIDNVRPMENILPLLFREKFFLGLKFFYKHIPFVIKIIPKRYYKYMFSKVVGFALALFLPILLFLIFEWQTVSNLLAQTESSDQGFVSKEVTKFISKFLLLFASYLFTKILSHFQLKEASSLKQNAENFIEKNSDFKYVTFGHTHNPEQYKLNGTWFFNTGTWIPIVELSSAAIRHDKTYTFIRFSKDQNNRFKAKNLQRWNDDAQRFDPLTLIEKKGE